MAGRGARVAAVLLLSGLLALSGDLTAQQSQSASDDFGGQRFDIPDPAKSGHAGQLYLSTCAGCHDQGLERAPHRLMFATMSPQSIFRALTDGKMQDQARSLSDQDKIALAEFLTGRKISAPSEAPEPPACKGNAAQFDFNEPPVFPSWGLAPGNTRSVPARVAGIDKSNVGRLHLKWAVAFPNSQQVRSEPALAGGALYVGSHNGGVYALDRNTGCARWIFQAGSEVRTGVVVSPWKAGDRAAKPMVYFGDIFGFVYAVDAVSGRLVWRDRADAHPNITLTGTPTLYEGMLYVPVSTLEGVRPADPHYECCTSRGEVVAYNALTGAVKWKTYSTDTPKLVGTNVVGAKQYAPSGAPIWNSPTIDAKRRQIYVGTGENISSPASATSDSILALDLDTGAVKWVYQGLAGDAMNMSCFMPGKPSCPKENGPDLDFGGASIMEVTLKDGRQILIGGQKTGVVHALDPDTGKLLWKMKLGRGGMVGGVHFGMAAGEGLLFIPINDGPDGQNYPDPPRPGLTALDPASGKTFWSAPANQDDCAGGKRCLVGYTQAITTTPGLVFAGNADGWLRIFDAHTGAMMWQLDSKIPVKDVNGGTHAGGSFGGGAGPLPYHGMLFASSGYGYSGGMPGNLLLAFDVQ